MHRYLIMLCLVMTSAAPGYSFAQFTGHLELLPAGCQATGQCTLKNKLHFKDADHVEWEAKAGLVTDGASIPGIFQPIIGAPFDPSFIKAAIIHDHYCDRHVRPWRQTHKVFYEGLIDQGVSMVKAKTMYLAVMLGGPKWVQLIPGIACGENCINNVKTVAGVPGYRFRNADYSAPDIAPAMARLAALLEADPDAISIEEIDAYAESLRPMDFYFQHGAEVAVNDTAAIE
ncbi:DUF1353 domain-containing protein [Janthinobacterium agaricidamnosum]|uniref:DUF1353 domain-containing protein n=1 Tax=Janthinobacterium agaricidamnosum NBRC 102515 = DSM 9628 TaxID=1349767 RepID=W0UXF6_9BURK|nr:DUF1353 domain-containing protein [Janthinobacterium agaricidamnosum]CDG81234.1 conserved hypothetical protein [Janthinobacterium agaricidamnosum NBRC 102515 = DSM 9628]